MTLHLVIRTSPPGADLRTRERHIQEARSITFMQGQVRIELSEHSWIAVPIADLISLKGVNE